MCFLEFVNSCTCGLETSYITCTAVIGISGRVQYYTPYMHVAQTINLLILKWLYVSYPYYIVFFILYIVDIVHLF
jgi:hypothetical protein